MDRISPTQSHLGCLLCSVQGRPLFGRVCTPCSDAAAAAWDKGRTQARPGPQEAATNRIDGYAPRFGYGRSRAGMHRAAAWDALAARGIVLDHEAE